QGKSFGETVRELGRRCGVEVPDRPETDEERARRDQRSRLYDVNAVATEFFRESLRSDAGKPGRDYLARRGVSEEVADSFRLGMAPDSWDARTRRLAARKIPPELAVVLGLIAPRREEQGHYDRFRNRLVCPVMLPAGEVVAFSARTLGPENEKT